MNHILTSQSVTILGADFVPKTMPSDHPAFQRVVEALKAGNDNEVAKLMDLPAEIVTFMQGEVQITDRVLLYKGTPLDTHLTSRILRFMEAGDENLAKPLIAFLNKVMLNPSRRAVLGLYEWCERSNLPITPDGDVIAYKIVQDDYLDIYSSTFDNTPGQTVSVERYEVDEDPDRTCSNGLHVCSPRYLPHYGTGPGSRVVVVRIHPKDFVAVPRDYDCAKARVSEYLVVGEMPREQAAEYFRDRFVFEVEEEEFDDAEVEEEAAPRPSFLRRLFGF